MSYYIELDEEKINMDNLKQLNQMCGGGIFDWVSSAPGKIGIILLKPVLFVFDTIIKVVEGLPVAGPLSDLKDLIMATIEQGKQNIQVVTVETIDGKEHYSLNSENQFLQIFANLVRAILPFAKDYDFEQVVGLFAPDRIGDTVVMLFGAILGHFCVIEKSLINFTFPTLQDWGLLGGELKNQQGGEIITITIIALAILGGVLGGLALVLIAAVVIVVAVLLFLTVVVLGLLWFFHDSIIWGITYIGNFATTLLLMIPVYIIAFKSDDPQSLDKALSFMKQVPVERPYDTMDNMTAQYSRSMASFDSTVGETAKQSIGSTERLATSGVGQLGEIGTGAVEGATSGITMVSGPGAGSGMGATGRIGTQLTQAALDVGVSKLTQPQYTQQPVYPQESYAPQTSSQYATQAAGGADVAAMTMCGVINQAKLLDPQKAKPEDMINAIGNLSPQDFVGPLMLLGQFLVLLYAVVFNYDMIKDKVDNGTVAIFGPDEIYQMLATALNANDETVATRAAAFEQVYPKGTPITEVAKQPTQEALEKAKAQAQAAAKRGSLGSGQAGGSYRRRRRRRRYRLVRD